MNAVIKQIYLTKKVNDLDGNSYSAFPTSISYEKGKALYDIITKAGSQKTLEIGMAYGLSSLFIGQAHKDKKEGKHIAIDPNQSSQWKSIGKLNINRAGLDKDFELIEKPSDIGLPELLNNGEKFDFIFIDGMHLFDYTLVDFFFADKLLAQGGYIVFDDIWMQSIRKVLLFILKNRNYQIAFKNPLSSFPIHRRIMLILLRLFRNPFDIFSYGYFILRGIKEICIIKKIDDDDREWHHYNFF